MATPNWNSRGDIRVSDTERDQAVAELSEHFLAGRLTQEEFDDRSGRALRARIGQELSELFADLPRDGATPPQATSPARQSPPRQAPLAVPGGGPPLRTRPPARLGVVGVVAAVIVLGVLFSSHSGHHISFGVPVPVLVAAVIILRRIRR